MNVYGSAWLRLLAVVMIAGRRAAARADRWKSFVMEKVRPEWPPAGSSRSHTIACHLRMSLEVVPMRRTCNACGLLLQADATAPNLRA
jgi:hypothetical protein